MSDIMNDVISEGVMQQPQSVVFYDDQGCIRFAFVGTSAQCEDQPTPAGLLRLNCDRPIVAFSSYVQDGVVIDKGDAPGPMMRFDYGQKSWVQDEALAWWMVRQVHDEKLRSSDWIDTMSAIDRLGVGRFSAWQQYRQALRDVPLQGDPYGVVWPVQPGGATLST
jgi:hypothetical protein